MRRLRILIVEDDDDLRALYSYMMAAEGYKVIEAAVSRSSSA